jgi:hypothetical protein
MGLWKGRSEPGCELGLIDLNDLYDTELKDLMIGG